MLNCHEVTHLVSRSLDRRLSWRERIAVRMHVLICAGCANFVRQMKFLRTAVQRLAQRDPPGAGGLTAAARARIARTLRDG